MVQGADSNIGLPVLQRLFMAMVGFKSVHSSIFSGAVQQVKGANCHCHGQGSQKQAGVLWTDPGLHLYCGTLYAPVVGGRTASTDGTTTFVQRLCSAHSVLVLGCWVLGARC